MSISLRLQELCDDAGMLRHGAGSRLANIAGVSVRTGNKWVNGMSIPTLQSILPLAKFFRVSADWLMTGEGDKYLGEKPVDSHALLSDYNVESSNCPKGIVHALRVISRAALDGELLQFDAAHLMQIAERIESRLEQSKAA
jgi:transcriptional regulator with XRE-family HTH domain